MAAGTALGTTASAPASLTVSQGSSSGTGTTTGSQTGQQQNTYQDWQSQLQQLLPGLLTNFTQGGAVPSGLTAPPQVFDAANQQFQENVAPGLVGQYGAGSPQIGAQQSYMDSQLAGNLYQSGVQNYLSGVGMLGGFATQPTGSTSSGTGQTTGTQTGTSLGTTSTDTSGTILGMLLQALKGTI